ncbi:MAG: pyruvate formate-lyase-activating protein [Lachnospiraceae bacterium]
MTQGRIHSTESFGTVDGPGVRFVIFTQGCPMRCAYCHNPDTWALDAGEMTDPSELIAEYDSKKGYYKDGGITVTGGEPLLQIDFIIDLFTLAKQRNIHTCIDTSGIVFNAKNTTLIEKLNRLMDLTDLIMLDIKHIDPKKHFALTQQPNDGILAFLAYLNDRSMPVWIRHVVVPGITDDEKYLYDLGYHIGRYTNVKVLDVLPYHTMGTVKYDNLGMEYPLKDVPAMNKDEAVELKKVVIQGVRDVRLKLGLITKS